MVVNFLEQNLRGYAGLVGVDHDRHPARQIGILHADNRGIAAVHVFQRMNSTGIEPTGGRVGVATTNTERSKPPTRLSSSKASTGALFGCLARSQSDVNADRIQRGVTGEFADPFLVWIGDDELLSLSADRYPTRLAILRCQMRVGQLVEEFLRRRTLSIWQKDGIGCIQGGTRQHAVNDYDQ